MVQGKGRRRRRKTGRGAKGGGEREVGVANCSLDVDRSVMPTYEINRDFPLPKSYKKDIIILKISFTVAILTISFSFIHSFFRRIEKIYIRKL